MNHLLATDVVSEMASPSPEPAVLRMHAMDAFFAATAKRHDLTLVTRNVKDFAGRGVRVLNPWPAEGRPG